MPTITKEASLAKAIDAFVGALRSARSSDYLPLAFRGSCPRILFVGEFEVSRSMLREWERRAWVAIGSSALRSAHERVVTYRVTDWGHDALERWQESRGR